MKKVIIVTWTGVHNYGTCLQSFALQYAVERLGHQTKIIDKIHFENPVITLFNEILFFFKRIISNKRTKRYKVDQFHRKRQHIIRPKTSKQLKKLVAGTDVFISGSDQIWNTAHRYTPIMFLNFVGNKKRISYATSIGTNDVPNEYQEIVKEHLRGYQHISVREVTAVNTLKAITGREDIIQVLDPTFLLTDKEWHKFGEKAKLSIELPDKYIFCYFVGDRAGYTDQVREVIKCSGIKNVVVATLKGVSNLSIQDAVMVHDAGPVEFVYLIEHAALVCTDSFHATAISINYGKPFVELLRFSDEDTGSQNSRIYDLLNHYGLKEHIYSDGHTRWMQPIDYKKVHDILHTDRAHSLEYLKSSVEN